MTDVKAKNVNRNGGDTAPPCGREASGAAHEKSSSSTHDNPGKAAKTFPDSLHTQSLLDALTDKRMFSFMPTEPARNTWSHSLDLAAVALDQFIGHDPIPPLLMCLKEITVAIQLLQVGTTLDDPHQGQALASARNTWRLRVFVTRALLNIGFGVIQRAKAYGQGDGSKQGYLAEEVYLRCHWDEIEKGIVVYGSRDKCRFDMGYGEVACPVDLLVPYVASLEILHHKGRFGPQRELVAQGLVGFWKVAQYLSHPGIQRDRINHSLAYWANHLSYVCVPVPSRLDLGLADPIEARPRKKKLNAGTTKDDEKPTDDHDTGRCGSGTQDAEPNGKDIPEGTPTVTAQANKPPKAGEKKRKKPVPKNCGQGHITNSGNVICTTFTYAAAGQKGPWALRKPS